MKIKELIKDTIPVLAGVLIALIIGDLKQRYDDRVYLDKMFAAMREEAKDNMLKIEEVIEGHKTQADSIENFIHDENINVLETILKTGGLQAPSVSNIAWKSVINSRAELVEYQTLSLFNKIEYCNNLVETKTNRISNHILSNTYSTQENDKAKLHLLFLDLLGQELTSVELYKEFLEEEE